MTDREPPETVRISLGEMRFVSAPPEGIPWKKIGGVIAAVWSEFPKLLLVVSLVALTGFTIAELRRDVVVIEPIRMPETLRKMGYSEDVAADRLWDAVGRINERTPTAKDPVDLQPASQRMNFEPPGSGIALQEVVQMLRRFLRLKETRIAGELICMTTACKPEELTLTLRVFRGSEMKVVSVPPIGDQTNEAEIDPYFHAAALELLRELDPYVVAFFLYQTDKPAAQREALKLIAPTHPQRKWALNLLGFIAADSGRYDRAIYWYGRAIKENDEDKFAAIARTNWGNALVAKEKLDEANEQFSLATRLDPKNAFAHNSWGLALVANDELAEAIEKFTHATKLDQNYAGAYNNWGKALLDMGEPAEAIEKFSLATELDPEYAVAYNNWGGALGNTGELAEAIEKFTLATEFDPNYAVAYYNWGKALRARDKLDEAIEKFTLATELDQKYANEILDIAFALSELSSADKPADAFDLYAGKAADAFERYLGLEHGSPIAGYVLGEIKRLRADPTSN